MTWYTFAVNGHRVTAPLSPAQAARLEATPSGEPDDLSERLGALVRRLSEPAPTGGSK
jgi:hypothetical protein